MLFDVTGVILIPGNSGEDCPGNGKTAGVECCCDECDYMMCCMEDHDIRLCRTCSATECPRNGVN